MSNSPPIHPNIWKKERERKRERERREEVRPVVHAERERSEGQGMVSTSMGFADSSIGPI